MADEQLHFAHDRHHDTIRLEYVLLCPLSEAQP